jgi:Family of unknown function (DUF6370)
MKTFGTLVLGLAAVALLGLTALAEDKKDEKEVTLKGTLTCGKCDLKMADACANVLKVTEKVDGKDKDVIYWLKDEGKDEKYHACQKPKMNVTVKGIVTKKDDKMWITPSKDGVKGE